MGPVPEWIKKEFSAGEYPELCFGEEKGLALPLSGMGERHSRGLGQAGAIQPDSQDTTSSPSMARPRAKL